MGMAVHSSQDMQSVYSAQINTLQAQVPSGTTQAIQIGNQIQATAAQQIAVNINTEAVSMQALATAELRKAHRETLLDTRALADQENAVEAQCGYLTVLAPPVCAGGGGGGGMGCDRQRHDPGQWRWHNRRPSAGDQRSTEYAMSTHRASTLASSVPRFVCRIPWAWLCRGARGADPVPGHCVWPPRSVSLFTFPCTIRRHPRRSRHSLNFRWRRPSTRRRHLPILPLADTVAQRPQS